MNKSVVSIAATVFSVVCIVIGMELAREITKGHPGIGTKPTTVPLDFRVYSDDRGIFSIEIPSSFAVKDEQVPAVDKLQRMGGSIRLFSITDDQSSIFFSITVVDLDIDLIRNGRTDDRIASDGLQQAFYRVGGSLDRTIEVDRLGRRVWQGLGSATQEGVSMGVVAEAYVLQRGTFLISAFSLDRNPQSNPVVNHVLTSFRIRK